MMKPSAEPGIVKRRRKPNVARYFKEARKGQEYTGTARVEVTDASGNKVTVKSSTPYQASTFANPWDECSKTDATN